MAMSEQPQPVAGAAASTTKARTSFGILGAISLSHLLNDMIQSLILAIYPLLQSEFSLTFMQIGMITLTFQLASSLLQPVVGYWTDKYPMPWSLPIGMCFTLSGLVLLALAGSFGAVLLAAALVGTGSSVFHPESSRVARMASGGRHGLAQSIFQVGGNFGSSLGPLLAAVIIAPYGKGNVAWFVLAALLAIVVLAQISRWYSAQHRMNKGKPKATIINPLPRNKLAALLAIVVLAQISRWYSAQHRMNKGKPKATIINPLPRNKVVLAVSILLILIFSKYFYMASISSYYTFYLMQKFGLSIQNAQLHLFAFLFAVAAGTVIGGPVGDKIGRKYVIWGSILGVAPFTLILPYASLHWTGVLTVIIGFILASAFSAILVYAQELLPGRIGMVSGLFFGFAFGMGGLGAAVLGLIADHTSIELVYKICAFLPLLGMLTIFLPDNRHKD
ncbi:MFS transporter [Escherichia coli]|nr:MFS transporter [Escherichia coli]